MKRNTLAGIAAMAGLLAMSSGYAWDDHRRPWRKKQKARPVVDPRAEIKRKRKQSAKARRK